MRADRCGTEPSPSPELLVDAVEARTGEIVAALRALTDAELLTPSLLRGWSRLTIACHLRYGAAALVRMTADASAGRPTAYYPAGRAAQRDSTLAPEPGESAAAVVGSLAAESATLTACWRAVGDWDVDATEPADNVDLGPLPLHGLLLARLTEVEVHGTDLGIGLRPWSDTFVTAALPFRLEWLNTRRSNHRAVDRSVQGSWLLAADDGERWIVRVDGDHVESRPAADDDRADTVIEGSAHDLLALLLGRDAPDLRHDGTFPRAFPGP